MKYCGYQIRVSCAAWEQVDILGDFWDFIIERLGRGDIVGLGYGWKDNYFNYAIGVIDDAETLAKIQEIDFGEGGFAPEYVEVELPAESEWVEYTGKTEKLREIYEKQIDCYNRKYDYELEYFDDAGNARILIHYTR